MNQGVFPGQKVGMFWDVLIAVFFGGIIFVVIVIATGGTIISLATAAISMLVFGLFHYVFWGRALLKNVARQRQQAKVRVRHEREEAALPDKEVMLALSERERTDMIEVLEQSLTAPPVEVHEATVADGARGRQRETIREILDRLRGFGA